MGTPQNGDPGSPFSREYGDPGPHSPGKMGTPGPHFSPGEWGPLWENKVIVNSNGNKVIVNSNRNKLIVIIIEPITT